MSVELTLLRSLMQKDFYDDHKGIKCPDRLFSKDVRKIKNALDYAMDLHDKDVTVQELNALFDVQNTTMTTANKEAYQIIFTKLGNKKPMNPDIAQ